MSMFDFLLPKDINEGYAKYKEEGGILLDVRTEEEYAEGHLAESVNIPLNDIGEAWNRYRDTEEKLFVYCRSGRRSKKAASALELMGFADVQDIGGIEDFEGELER